MSNDNVIKFDKPETTTTDLLTNLLKEGAQKLIAQAVEKELKELLNKHQDLKIDDNKSALIRNGYLPERTIQTGLGPVVVKIPKIRDRSDSGIKFNSTIVPPYLKRTGNMEDFLPWLYLRGISTNKFEDCLTALFGEKPTGVSTGTICRLKKVWEKEYSGWSERDLSNKRYVYWWADGIYFNVKSDNNKQCILVVIGVLENGKKEIVSITDGFRESEPDWYNLLVDLHNRGLNTGPKLASGDGALGFWNALDKLYPDTKHQRCWVHKTANILNKLPKSFHANAKSDLQNIWMAATEEKAIKAYNKFINNYKDKYPKAAQCLDKDKSKMLEFYNFPAAHWRSIRTTNPIESMFATVRSRTKSTKNCGSRNTILAMVFKLSKCAEKNWYRMKGFKELADVINNVKFVDGVKVNNENLNEGVA